MNRLTRVFDGKDLYIIDDSCIQHDEKGYSGEAVTRLAMFENMYYDLISKQNEISVQMEKLRMDGKTNSVKFKQLLANKLANSNILILLKTYGLE